MQLSSTDLSTIQEYFIDMYNDLSDLPPGHLVSGKMPVEQLRDRLQHWVNGLAAISAQTELLENSLETKFQPKTYVIELNRELAMRRKVYANVPGFPEQFKSMDDQVRYDVLKELRDILDTVGIGTLKRMQAEYSHIKQVIQCSLFQ